MRRDRACGIVWTTFIPKKHYGGIPRVTRQSGLEQPKWKYFPRDSQARIIDRDKG
jgi:hypothetical protein